MLIVQGIKKYRDMVIDEDLLPDGHAEILISKGQLIAPANEEAPAKKSKKSAPK